MQLRTVFSRKSVARLSSTLNERRSRISALPKSRKLTALFWIVYGKRFVQLSKHQIKGAYGGYNFDGRKYRKIPISPGFEFVQKAFFLGLFSEGHIVGILHFKMGLA